MIIVPIRCSNHCYMTYIIRICLWYILYDMIVRITNRQNCQTLTHFSFPIWVRMIGGQELVGLGIRSNDILYISIIIIILLLLLPPHTPLPSLLLFEAGGWKWEKWESRLKMIISLAVSAGELINFHFHHWRETLWKQIGRESI